MMEDLCVIQKIPRSMPLNFDYVVCVIEELKHLDTMTFEQLEGLQQAHEDKIKRRQENLWSKFSNKRSLWIIVEEKEDMKKVEDMIMIDVKCKINDTQDDAI